MSEIPTYPDECGHRQEKERCWQCLTLELCCVSDALRVEKERVVALQAEHAKRVKVPRVAELELQRTNTASPTIDVAEVHRLIEKAASGHDDLAQRYPGRDNPHRLRAETLRRWAEVFLPTAWTGSDT